MLPTSPEWSFVWQEFLIDIAGGIIGAFIFLFLILFLLRPKIRIAGFLCRITKQSDIFYKFKFVNISLFSAHEIKVELHEFNRIPKGNGEFNYDLKKLELVNSHLPYMPRRPFFWVKDPSHKHCFTVRTTVDIQEILSNEHNAILIRITLKHGLTGLSDVFEQEFAEIADIKESDFKPGPKFAV